MIMHKIEMIGDIPNIVYDKVKYILFHDDVPERVSKSVVLTMHNKCTTRLIFLSNGCLQKKGKLYPQAFSKMAISYDHALTYL